MKRPLVMLHGWSDHSATFKPLAHELEKRLALQPTHLMLADYISLDDEVRYDDLVLAMDRAWTEAGLPRDPCSVDAIVHSTGSLVMRHWLHQYFEPTKSPLDHLLMLAPANAGSPLAHQGKALIGRLLKGFGHPKPFEVGAQLLDGLELSSPYTYDLAMKDRFAPNPFHAGHTKTTVLVGDQGYGGLAAVANRPGTDGTVRLSNANMNVEYFHLDFSQSCEGQPHLTHRTSLGRTAFAVMPGFNHRTITGVDAPSSDPLFDTMVKALQVQAEGFDAWCDTCATSQTHQAYQSTVVRCCDQYGQPVPSYFIHLSESSDDADAMTGSLNTEGLAHVHPYRRDPSYRSFLFNASVMRDLVGQVRSLHWDITATPELGEHTDEVVGFYPLHIDGQCMPWVVDSTHLERWFQVHQTVYMDVTLYRGGLDQLYTLRSLS